MSKRQNACIKLVTQSDQTQREARRLLLRAARSRPRAVAVVWITNDNVIESESRGMNRLEVMGASLSAIMETWGPPGVDEA